MTPLESFRSTEVIIESNNPGDLISKDGFEDANATPV